MSSLRICCKGRATLFVPGQQLWHRSLMWHQRRSTAVIFCFWTSGVSNRAFLIPCYTCVVSNRPEQQRAPQDAGLALVCALLLLVLPPTRMRTRCEGKGQALRTATNASSSSPLPMNKNCRVTIAAALLVSRVLNNNNSRPNGT